MYNKGMRLIAGIVAVVAVVVGVLLVWPDRTVAPVGNNGGGEVRGMSVEEYVRQNISTLSPEPAVLGGTFYVTEISVGDDGTGVVHYEDGHIALVADFTWQREQEHGALTIQSFVVREQ